MQLNCYQLLCNSLVEKIKWTFIIMQVLNWILKKLKKDKTPHSEKHTLPFQPKVKQRHQILFFDLCENQTKQKHLFVRFRFVHHVLDMYRLIV